MQLCFVCWTLVVGDLSAQYQWNWRDPLDLNHFDWGDNKLLLYNSIGLGLTLKLSEPTHLQKKEYKKVLFSSYIDILSEYSRSPISDVIIGRLRWSKSIRKFLLVGADLSIYKVDDAQVNTEGVGVQAVFSWVLLQSDDFKLIFDNGVGPNMFLDPFPFGGTRFNFTSFYGLYAHIRLPGIAWLTIGVKNIHISNAGIKGADRNPALDGIGLSVGYQFFGN